jgi:catechol 2,3-dioxygenase-like lactoylglutathione lyase family enzyme
MALAALDHVTIRTARLGALTDFYARVLGLVPGKRPPFDFAGAWLYCDGHAALHLVEVADSPEVPAPRIEHFAFRAEGRAENLADFLARLRDFDVAYRTAVVPEFGIRQVHLRDPDGNHIEIAFAPEEDAEPGDPPGG